MRQGLARDEAVRRARLEFGGLDQIKEEHRDARGIGVRRRSRPRRAATRSGSSGARRVSRCSRCSASASASASTRRSSACSTAVLLRPMPVADPDRLIMSQPRPDRGLLVSRLSGFPGAQPRARRGSTASLPMESDLEVDGESEFVAAEVVSANYADVLGLRPSLGRWFANDREPAAVISHAVWQRRFNLEPGCARPADSLRIAVLHDRRRRAARIHRRLCADVEPTSGCRSGRARGWPRNSRIATATGLLMLFGTAARQAPPRRRRRPN